MPAAQGVYAADTTLLEPATQELWGDCPVSSRLVVVGPDGIRRTGCGTNELGIWISRNALRLEWDLFYELVGWEEPPWHEGSIILTEPV